ncbi:MAG: hypothetical protein ACD_9C00268G0008 [uncultured bacterium]|nr:MAG: hypothetical protein ACD_9C00268G0008 [uncultured bacterium]
MKNKKGNVAVIAIIIVIVAITASVITWLVATKSQAPVQKEVANKSVPVLQTQQTMQQSSATQSATNVIPSDESLAWTIYEMEGFEYSFNYPSKIYSSETKGNELIGFGDDGFVFKSLTGSGKIGDFNGPDYFHVNSNINDHMTIDSMEGSLKTSFGMVTRRPLRLANEDAIILAAEREETPNENKSLYEVHIYLKEKHRAQISFWGKPDDNIAKTIISSFRFYEKSQN